MCTGIEPYVIMLAAGALSAGAAIQQSQQQASDQRVQAHQTDIDAKQEQQAAEERSNLIRKAGARTRANAIAAYGAAGVDVDSGSAQAVDQRIATDVESDAWSEILTGKRVGRRMEVGSRNLRRSADNIQRQGYYSAAGTLLSSGSQAYRAGWSSRPPMEQAPAPIVDRSIRVNS